MSGTSSLPIITTTTASDAPTNSTDSGNNNNNGGFSPPSSTLYLLTFLATLFVLLFVSCAIVLRSFFLRRRFRRHVEEQIAAGLMPPEAALHFPRRVDVGAKPTLYDVFIQPTGEPGETWDHISPVAAKIIMPDPPPDADEPPPAEPTPITSARRNRLSRLIPRRRAPPEPTVPPDSPQHEDFAAEGREMQVSVMVAMPGAHRMKDDGVPDVLLGVSQVSLRPDNSP